MSNSGARTRDHAASHFPPVAIACPQCAGPVAVVDGMPWANCPHCRVSLALDVGRLLVRGVIRASVRESDVRGLVERFLRDAEIDDPVVIVSAKLEFRPYFFAHLPGRPAAIVESVPDAESVDYATVQAAFDAGRVEAFTDDAIGSAEVILPTYSAEDLRAAFPEEAFCGRTRDALRLVHVPVWRVQYHVGALVHDLTIDGVTGRVSALAVPPANSQKLNASAILWLTGTIVVATALAALLPIGWTLVVYLAAVAACWFGGRRKAPERP